MVKTKKQDIKPNLTLAVTIDPLHNFTYYASNLLGDINVLLVRYFYSKSIAQKVYVTLCELLNNVVDHIKDRSSMCKVLLTINPETVVIKVKNKTNKSQYDKVKAHIAKIKKIKNQKVYFAEIMKKRQKQGLTGGLGFLRLFIENTKDIGIKYNKRNSYMTIISRLKLKE